MNVENMTSLKGLGPKSLQMLADIGIVDVEQLRQMGAVRAYVAVKNSNAAATLNLLWALEGAITGMPWQEVARLERTRLLLALDDVLRAVPLKN